MIDFFEKISYKEIVNNIDLYINKFLKNGIVVFKQSYFSEDEQLKILINFGDRLGWFPNSSNKIEEKYTENHAYTLSKPEYGFSDPSGDKSYNLMLPWHLEGIENVNTQIAAAWNMNIFTCEKSFGKTGFVNAAGLFSDMPKEWQDFLVSSVIQEKYPGHWGENAQRSAALVHYATNEYIVRINATIQTDGWETMQKLVSIDKKIPSKADIILFTKIKQWIYEEVFFNKNRQLWWEWSEGDLVIPDLLKMHHAVSGGFLLGERKFVGFWCRKFLVNDYYSGNARDYK
jgi:hypothetical protein